MSPSAPFSTEEYRNALVRRRIKYVVEKGAMARLFRRGTNRELQDALFQHLRPAEIAKIQTRDKYDEWLTGIVELACWRAFSKNGLRNDRWAYFAKLVNIVVYEIVANRELLEEGDWLRLRAFLHLPIDQKVADQLNEIDSSIPAVGTLKGMTKKDYWEVQSAVRQVAERHNVPPTWFEAAYAAKGRADPAPAE